VPPLLQQPRARAVIEAIGRFEVLPPLTAFAVAWAAQRMFLESMLSTRLLDYPNHRSLHQRPTPRTGGIALLLGTAAGWAWLPPAAWMLPLSGATLALALLSLTDDLRGLPAGLRLAAHFGLCAAFGFAMGLDWLLVLALLLPMVWGVNLYNFMDGLDGLASGAAVLGFGAYALTAALHGGSGIALLASCVAAAALGFLPFNFSPARAFLGDVGSITLGFLAAAIGIIGWRDGLWPVWFPVLAFAPFIADASVTLARRAVRRTRLAEAHREHYYQRLALLGFGHRKTALLEYSLLLVSGGTAVFCSAAPRAQSIAAMLLLAALLGAFFVAVDRAWSRMGNRKEGGSGEFQQQGPQQ
jgi:UDP-N-acetylmuramyl pentapeptide phosphotransferase/UDP-N-acetylglucosamine-1-phosphate transferase